MTDVEGLDWAKDLVLTELRRAFPERLDRIELQERTGLGAAQLRVPLDELDTEGQLDGSEEGYRLTEEAYDGNGSPEGDLLAAEPDLDGSPAGAVEGLGELSAAAGEAFEAQMASGETRYEAQLLVTVGFYPEIKTPGEDQDVAAMRDAQLIAERAAAGIRSSWPDLPVASKVMVLQAFDRPRDVLPGS